MAQQRPPETGALPPSCAGWVFRQIAEIVWNIFDETGASCNHAVLHQHCCCAQSLGSKDGAARDRIAVQVVQTAKIAVPLRVVAVDRIRQSDGTAIYAIIAGIAGAMLTQTTSTVSLGVLDFQRSADVLVILILGGTGRLYGGLLGAIIFMVARDQFSGINPQLWYFWIGLLLVSVVMLLRNGVLGGLARLMASPRGGL